MELKALRYNKKMAIIAAAIGFTFFDWIISWIVFFNFTDSYFVRALGMFWKPIGKYLNSPWWPMTITGGSLAAIVSLGLGFKLGGNKWEQIKLALTGVFCSVVMYGVLTVGFMVLMAAYLAYKMGI